VPERYRLARLLEVRPVADAVSAREKYLEAKREAALRRRVYPRWVEAGKIKMHQAELQILIMDAIAEDYRLKAEHDEREERLL
jgi:hypothetical protein